ncbi:MAG TPA: GNAT family N-acetyltransferase [Pyrinomonadaceae bacterium]|jgi:GNAT superfamily N-acetyltransferase|nr:GNAT family N-acetyltransferase [Pyrinomonadaceae bacterium]
MSGDVQIKQFETSDEDALLSFLRLAYADEPIKSDPTFWRWHFLENPYASPDDVPLWIARCGERVVGQMATIPVQLKVGEDERRALWIIDFILLPEYRGRKLGKRLMQVARETYCKTMIALGYNEQSEAVLRSHKWVSLGSINRYHKLLFPGNAAREISRLGPVRHLANLVYAPLRPRLSKLSPVKSLALREVKRFDSSFDDLWKDASAQWPCAVVRNSRFLEWQFMKQPGKKYDVLACYEQERLLGYVVLFFRKAEGGGVSHKAAISDVCYSSRNSQEVIDSLLKGALRLAMERRAGSLVTDVLDPLVEQSLRKLGFLRIKASPPFMAGTDEHQDLIYERDNWFLTRADSDVSIFEQPNL